MMPIMMLPHRQPPKSKMRTTIALDGEILAQAQRLSGPGFKPNKAAYASRPEIG